jgi:hypothetical protein
LVNDSPGTAQTMAPLARLLAAYRTFAAPFGVDPTVTLVANSFLLLVAGALTVAAR